MRAILSLILSFGLRCPNCRGPRITRYLYNFHKECPNCGLIFLKDDGDFWGGVVICYTWSALAGLITASILYVFQWLEWQDRLYFSAGMSIFSIIFLMPFAKAFYITLLFITRGHYEEYRAPEPNQAPPESAE